VQKKREKKLQMSAVKAWLASFGLTASKKKPPQKLEAIVWRILPRLPPRSQSAVVRRAAAFIAEAAFGNDEAQELPGDTIDDLVFGLLQLVVATVAADKAEQELEDALVRRGRSRATATQASLAIRLRLCALPPNNAHPQHPPPSAHLRPTPR
jgi:hypothetical protein